GIRDRHPRSRRPRRRRHVEPPAGERRELGDAGAADPDLRRGHRPRGHPRRRPHGPGQGLLRRRRLEAAPRSRKARTVLVAQPADARNGQRHQGMREAGDRRGERGGAGGRLRTDGRLRHHARRRGGCVRHAGDRRRLGRRGRHAAGAVRQVEDAAHDVHGPEAAGGGAVPLGRHRGLPAGRAPSAGSDEDRGRDRRQEPARDRPCQDVLQHGGVDAAEGRLPLRAELHVRIVEDRGRGRGAACHAREAQARVQGAV
ncbi:MAG: Enoyl-CoA hydratase, partial [uncultured Craurococcus sp.]